MREGRLVIRLNDEEAAAVSALAEAERLPASTLARRLLLAEADRQQGRATPSAGTRPGASPLGPRQAGATTDQAGFEISLAAGARRGQGGRSGLPRHRVIEKPERKNGRCEAD